MLAAAAFAEPYTRLFKIHNPVGDCQIRRPGAAAFEPAERGKAYPFGTRVECGRDSSAVLLFSDADAVRLLDNSAATVTLDEGEVTSRVVALDSGTALTRIHPGTAEDFIVVDTPAGRVRSLSGNGKVVVTSVAATRTEPAAYDVELRAEPASKMKFIGRQFIIPTLKNGFGARVFSATDDSHTVVTDLLGDYGVLINTGLDSDPPEPYEENPELSRINLSAKAAVNLWREKAAIGGATVVAVLSTTPSGKGRESFAFAVGKADIAARSNVFIDTITNELATAEAARTARADISDGDADFAASAGDDGFGDLGDFGGDVGGTGGESGGDNDSAKSADDFDFLL